MGRPSPTRSRPLIDRYRSVWSLQPTVNRSGLRLKSQWSQNIASTLRRGLKHSMRKLSLAFILAMAPVLQAAPLTVPLETLGRVESTPRTFILSIGVATYQDSFWPRLKWPTTDAKNIASQIGQGTGRTLVTQVLLDEDASLKSIRDSLKNLQKVVKQKDNLVVYFSGHGTLGLGRNGDMEKVLVLNATRKEQLFSTGLTQRSLIDEIKKIRADKTLVMFASCYSGLGKSKLPEDIQQILVGSKGKPLRTLEDDSEGLLVLAASAMGETAREEDRFSGDIYTHFFLEGLSTYDRNGDGAYSALEAHDYAVRRTFAFTEGRQRPTAEIRMIGSADLVLKGKRSRESLPVLEAYQSRYEGLSVQIAGGEKGSLPSAFPLQKGMNELVIRREDKGEGEGEGEPVASYKMKANAGETIRLEDLVAGPPYTLGLSLLNRTALNKQYQNLINRDRELWYRLSIGYSFPNLGFEIFRDFTPTQKTTQSKSLKSSLNRSRYGLLASYRENFLQGLHASFFLKLTHDDAKLKYQDQASDESLEYKAQGIEYGLGASLFYSIGLSWELGMDLSH
ncbi:MAG: caspase family protein, partial [Proteobacteria bacterium]